MRGKILTAVKMATVIATSFFCSCKALQESSKYGFNDGTYNVKSPTHSGKAYVVVNQDSVKAYPLHMQVVDTTNFIDLALPEKSARRLTGKYSFVANSFDFDVLTILFKYRPSRGGFPNQLNTNLNGAAYLGYRSDVFKVRYSKKPGFYKRRVEHYGYSAGGFFGIGATAMNPWVTSNNITEEYDGVVITKGIALNIAVNSFTFGLAVGWDHLLDRNRKFWIYQGSIWTGATLGLNLN
jgi:hypothetical protein